MFFGSNLQFLRRRDSLTQEQLAQQMGVSRQTVSKWESGQPPELNKLLELADRFHCSLDDLLRQDLSVQTTPVEICLVKGFSMARYTMISPNAEADLQFWMENWAKHNALISKSTPYLTWTFPHVSAEQKKHFGLTGACAAYVLPPKFRPRCEGPEITVQPDHHYAVMHFPEPLGRQSRHIAGCIQTILEFLRESGIAKSAEPGILPCFESRYEKNGTPWAALFLQCKAVENAEVFTFEPI